MEPVAVALVGAGVIGRAHAKLLSALPPEEGHLAAIADPGPGAADLAASLRVPHFAAIEAMLDAVRPGAAIIATPNRLHVAGARACIAREVAVLVEKPLAEDLGGAQSIAAE